MRTFGSTHAPTRAPSPQRVLGRYDLIEVIGRGATSRVYRALDRATGHEVAVKEIPVDLGLEKRVAAEIRAAARLQHESVVRMLDWGEDAEDWADEDAPEHSSRATTRRGPSRGLRKSQP
mgnify:CR=1 FL=1